MPRLSEPSPYVEFDRTEWRGLRMSTPLKLSEDEVVRLRGLGEKLDLLEVEEVYLPLARLIHLQVAARQALFATTAQFLGEPLQHPDRPVPFIIGVAGSVAVGKSTTARVLQALLARWEDHPRVDLVTTDGFLYPNAELELQTTDSTTGVSGALEGTYTIGMASRELKDSEVEGGAKATVLALDGIAVVVNPANTTEDLTVDQIKGIYTGELTTWADVQ